MAHSILLFGMARELLGSSQLSFAQHAADVKELRMLLLQEYPALAEIEQLQIAVNQRYAEESMSLDGDEEIALLPPVSGG